MFGIGGNHGWYVRRPMVVMDGNDCWHEWQRLLAWVVTMDGMGGNDGKHGWQQEK